MNGVESDIGKRDDLTGHSHPKYSFPPSPQLHCNKAAALDTKFGMSTSWVSMGDLFGSNLFRSACAVSKGKQGENPLHTEGIPAHPDFSNVEVPSSLGS